MPVTHETKIMAAVLLGTLAVIIGGAFLSGRNAVDLSSTAGEPVDATRLVRPDSWSLGAADALVTVVEFGDFECPACGTLHPILQQVKQANPDVRFVWRNFPLTTIHKFAQSAAEAAEAAGQQGKFFEYHDLIFENQTKLTDEDLLGYAQKLGLNIDQFQQDIKASVGRDRVQQDKSDGASLNVNGTPTLFINALPYQGAYSVGDLQTAIDAAKE